MHTHVQKQSPAQKVAPSASSVFDASSQSESLQRKADIINNATQRAEAPRPNNTGMPDNLKAGIESLSGFSMDDVRVHYNSSKPATVQALAYTQGTDIHVAPGQEKHLPHEAWHVAQQMAGRVSPTTNINGMPVNDNAGLEHEADVMGEKAVTQRKENGISTLINLPSNNMVRTIQCIIGADPYPHLNLDVGWVPQEEPENKPPAAASKSKQADERHRAPDVNSSVIADEVRNPPELPKEDLPCIAFETMASADRKDELKNLYNKEIKRYNGKAHVIMGINKSVDFCNVVHKDDKLKEAKNIVCTAANDVSKIKENKKKEHEIIIIPFINEKVGSPEDDYTFPFYEARGMLMNHAPTTGIDLYRWIDSDVTEDESIDVINRNGFIPFGINIGEDEIMYDNVFFRQFIDSIKDDRDYPDKLKELPISSKGDLDALRTSILSLSPTEKDFVYRKMKCFYNNLRPSERINIKLRLRLSEGDCHSLRSTPGEKQKQAINSFFKQMFEKDIDSRIYSGFYKWKKTAIELLGKNHTSPELSIVSTGEPHMINQVKVCYQKLVDLVNQYEIELRKKYHFLMCSRKIPEGPGVLGVYYPESSLYMNQYAHEKAKRTLLSHGNIKENKKQDRESEIAVKGCHVEVNDQFMLSKPLKGEFTADPKKYSGVLEKIAGLHFDEQKKVHEAKQPDITDLNLLSHLRQTAFGTGWAAIEEKKDLFKKLKDEWQKYLARPPQAHA